MDSDIANGTCYYGYNKAAGTELVPCGNAGIANVPCCFGGDYCDADNTCFNNATGNTYLAGCTDLQYTDSSCPFKSDEFADQEWVGLIRCNAVNETANEWAWAGCSVPSDSYTSLERLGSCDCTSKSTLFVGGQALLRHASIPSSVGGSISWVEGYAVTAVQTTSTTSTSPETATAGSVATESTALATSTTASTATTAAVAATAAVMQATSGGNGSAGSSLSAGAKAGIAVGSIGAVLSILAIAVMVFLHRRRRRGGQSNHSDALPHDKVPGSPTVVIDGNENMAPPAYSGHKAELPGNGTTISIRAASPRLRSTPSMVSSLALTPEMAHSELGERRMSMVSELSNNDDGQRGGYTVASPTGMAPIAELQG